MQKHNFSFGILFDDLYKRESLQKLDKIFLKYLQQKDNNAYSYLIDKRSKQNTFLEKNNNNPNFLNCAKIFENFLLELFPKANYDEYHKKLKNANKLFIFRKLFVNKYVKQLDFNLLENYSFKDIEKKLLNILKLKTFNEETLIENVLKWLENKEKNTNNLEVASIFGSFIFFQKQEAKKYQTNLFFKAKKTDFTKLIPDLNKSKQNITKDISIKRENFNLYTKSNLADSLHQSNYCIKCHKRERDYCKKGTKEKEEYINNSLGEKIQGCPLSMDISQMHQMNEEGFLIGALAIITINNPLVAATGYNICNDCLKSCIFQKQEAVDTPKVESHILKEVLALSWGFEIYSLLTRWNPLRFYRPFPKEKTDYNILVVGLGPAGYSLSYNLLQEGHNVIAIDALKIEPISKKEKDLITINNKNEFKPIININEIYENLDERIIQGFGGVSEYGITARWDKNFLKVLRIILQRNQNFLIQGSTRLGSNITFEDAKNLGFHHIALCQGAGKPNMINLKNIDINGIKSASEFLMNLHIGSFKKDNLFNMEISFPIVIIGGGLTAIDSATESLLYYQRQLEKHIPRYLNLVEMFGKEKILKDLTNEEKEKLQEYLYHYKLLQENPKNKIATLQSLGGVKVVYHRSLEESRAYKTNHHELERAFNQGIEFIENASIKEIKTDKYNNLSSIICTNNLNKEDFSLNTKTLIIATGTNSNNISLKESSNIFTNEASSLKEDTKSLKNNNILTFKGEKFSNILQEIFPNFYVSFFGDMHKKFKGSVVKALASSFYGQYEINKVLQKQLSKKNENIFTKFIDFTKIKIVDYKLINEKMYEITLQGKSLIKNIQAGQFIKIQNFETSSGFSNKISKMIEPIVLTPFAINKENNSIKCIILKVGTSSYLLEKDLDNINVIAPLGSATKIIKNSKIVIIATSVANTTGLNLLQHFNSHNNQITYIAGFKTDKDIFHLESMKKLSDKLIISIEENLSQNINALNGNIIAALKVSKEELKKADAIFIAGSCNAMNAISEFLKDNNIKNKNQIISTNYPMICALKGVCATCLAINSKGHFYYSCEKQEQNLKDINFINLNNRLKQNSLQEKISMKILLLNNK